MLPKELVNLLTATFAAPVVLPVSADDSGNLDEDPEEPCVYACALMRLLTLTSWSSVDDFLEKLLFFFDDNLLLAALDLVDRGNGGCCALAPAPLTCRTRCRSCQVRCSMGSSSVSSVRNGCHICGLSGPLLWGAYSASILHVSIVCLFGARFGLPVPRTL